MIGGRCALGSVMRVSAFAFLLLVPACGATAPATLEVPAVTPPMPAQLVVPDLVGAPPRAPIGRVYPLGWSPAGLFAYAYEPPDEACGCYFFRVIVVELPSAHVVWEMSHDSGENLPPFDLEELWREQGGLISTRLDQLGIVRRDEPALQYLTGETISEGDPEGVEEPILATSPGLLASPYGKVCAVLIEEEWRGWEGPPNVHQLRFEGQSCGSD
jgi:hypothetical protein